MSPWRAAVSVSRNTTCAYEWPMCTFAYACDFFVSCRIKEKSPVESQNHKWWLKWKVSLQTCPVEVVLNYMGAWELLRAVMNMASVLDATVDVLGLRWRYGVCHWTATNLLGQHDIDTCFDFFLHCSAWPLCSSMALVLSRILILRICQLVIRVQSAMGRYGPQPGVLFHLKLMKTPTIFSAINIHKRTAGKSLPVFSSRLHLNRSKHVYNILENLLLAVDAHHCSSHAWRQEGCSGKSCSQSVSHL